MNHFAIVAAIAIALCAGCQRDAGEAPAPAGSTDGSGQQASTPAAADADITTVQPVLRWECDAGVALTTKAMPRDRAISLGLHEGERKLPQVPSASGEKYQDGPITFWRKGGTAIYERTPAPPIDCRLASA